MINNVHERVVSCSHSELAAALERIAEPEGWLWPRDDWAPLVLDGNLAVGAAGGHGPIKYSVVTYEPGKRVEFQFASSMPIRGTHTFELTQRPATSTVLVHHEIVAEPVGVGRIVWPLAVRWLHDALIEDLLDRAEARDGSIVQQRKYSPWVRVLRWITSRQREQGHEPATD